MLRGQIWVTAGSSHLWHILWFTGLTDELANLTIYKRMSLTLITVTTMCWCTNINILWASSATQQTFFFYRTSFFKNKHLCKNNRPKEVYICFCSDNVRLVMLHHDSWSKEAAELQSRREKWPLPQTAAQSMFRWL